METVKAKIKGTSTILEGCVCDDSFFVSVDHDIFERYALCEVEICKDSLQAPETCKENQGSFTSLEEAAEISFDEARALTEDYRDFLAKGLTENRPRPIGPHWFCEYAKNRFIAGSEWKKEQMMKDAVEAKIYGYDDGSFELIASWLDIPNNSIYKDGDKVKIIIVKKG